MEFKQEETRKKREIKGITDKVTNSTYEGKNYPVVNVLLTEATPKYKLQALSRLLKSSVKTYDVDNMEEDQSIYVALKTDSIYKPVGRVTPQQVKTLMSILMGVNVELELEEGKVMDRMYIYALSS